MSRTRTRRTRLRGAIRRERRQVKKLRADMKSSRVSLEPMLRASRAYAASREQTRLRSGRSYRLLKQSGLKRVQDFSSPHSCAARDPYTEAKILQFRGRMGVSRYNKLDVSLSGLSCPSRLEIKPVWTSADLNSRPRLRDHVQDLFHTH